MCLSRRPDGRAELERLHVLAAIGILLHPGAGIEIDDDAIGVRVYRRCFAVTNCFLQTRGLFRSRTRVRKCAARRAPGRAQPALPPCRRQTRISIAAPAYGRRICMQLLLVVAQRAAQNFADVGFWQFVAKLDDATVVCSWSGFRGSNRVRPAP